MNKFYILPAVIALGLATPAFAADDTTTDSTTKVKVEKDTDGSYHKKASKTAESTDSAGTTTKSETKVDVNSDANGNGKRTVSTESSTDPKGLMNKTKTATTDSTKISDGKMEKKHKKTVDGKTVEENSSESTTQ